MSRDDVAAAQGALLRAVLAGADVPPGFDPEVVRVEAAALLGKRRRIVRDIDPETADALGDRFAELFAEYARGNPRRSGSRFREDAAAFAEWAVEHGHLPRARRRWWRKER